MYDSKKNWLVEVGCYIYFSHTSHGRKLLRGGRPLELLSDSRFVIQNVRESKFAILVTCI
ncbi:hypothetical protein HanIR_Chr01g0033161 [Helianthus annuus]|nr:hypothetical protein HanIR_Chr01g0033161 [Helianthus annuus]